MYFTRVLNVVRKHTNEFTGIIKEGPDRAYGRRKIKMMTGHYYGRGRNCYMLASRQLQKGLEHVTKNRELSRKDFRELCDLRIEAGAKDLHYDPFYMRDTLARLHIGLNTKVLANLAIWEPRSFRSIVGLCAHKESKFDEPQKEIKSGSALPCDYPDKRGPYVPGPGTKVIDRGLL